MYIKNLWQLRKILYEKEIEIYIYVFNFINMYKWNLYAWVYVCFYVFFIKNVVTDLHAITYLDFYTLLSNLF